MIGAGISRAPQVLIIVGVALVAALVGAVLPIYAVFVGESPIRLMILPALVLLGLLLLLNPQLLLLLILFFRAATDHLFESSRISIGGYLTGLGGLLNAFVILVVLVLVVQRPALFPKRLALAWAPFLLTALYGVVISPIRGDAVRIYLTLITYFSVFISAFYVVRTEQDFRFCVRLVFWSSVLPAAYALVDIALNWGGTGFGGFRLESTFTHPNIFAFYLTMVVSLCLYMLKSKSFAISTGKRMLLTAYVLYLLSLLVLTQTRSAWIACLAVFTVYGLFFERRYLIYIVIGCLFALLLAPVRERLLDLATDNEYVLWGRLNSFAWRRMLWETALQWMQPQRYLFGYGAESFRYYSTIFFPAAGAPSAGAHNVYVQWLFEYGAAGLLAFTWLFYKMLRAVGAMRAGDIIAAFVSTILIIGYLIISLSDNMMAYLAFNWYFWFVIGAACAVVGAHQGQRARSQGTHVAGSANMQI